MNTMKSEKMPLMTQPLSDTEYAQEQEMDERSPKEKEKHRKLLNLKESSFVMLGVSLGTGILLMPYVIRQLGVIGWLVCLILVIFIYSICAIILSWSTAQFLEEDDSQSLIRDPYQLIAEQASGNIMRKALIVFFYVTLLSCCMALLLVSASILSNLIPIQSINHSNKMRIWSVVLVVLLTPVTYLGTYSELRLPALLAVSTALSSACLIVVNSVLYKFVFAKPGDFSQAKVQNADQIFFIPLGTILFGTAGSFAVPNIASVAASPTQLHKSFIGAYICVFVVMSVAGIVPYIVFGEFVQSNTVTTFYSVINDGRRQDDITAFFVITVVIEVLMMLHLCSAIVLIMNPLFLHMEKFAGAPDEFTLKRVVIRTMFMVFCLTVSLIEPHFEPVLSLTGGIPFTFIGIIIPLVIYINLFPVGKYHKILVYVFLLGLGAMVAGNFVASVQQMVTIG